MKPHKCIVFRSMDPQSLGGTPFRMKCTYHTNLCDTYNDNACGSANHHATCKEYSYMSAKVISYVIIDMHLVGYSGGETQSPHLVCITNVLVYS